MSSPIYNVPLALAADYPGQRLVVRTDDPAALVARWPTPPVDWLCVQLVGLPDRVAPLIHWGRGLAIDIVLADPVADYARLYRYAKLIDNHPVRVSLPVVEGIDKAVRLAASLHFAVKLEPGQPSAISELAEILDLYLHQATTPQPIDYFHEVLLGWLHDSPVELWTVLDEDPTGFRHVAEDGGERFPPRLAGASGDPEDFVRRWQEMLIETGAECQDCAYRDVCGGYFKWPNPDYDCAGVKQLFATLRAAADELRSDLARYATTPGSHHDR